MRIETLRFKSLENNRLAKWLTGVQGRSLTEAITEGFRERLDRVEGRPNRAGTRAAVARIQGMMATHRELDQRASEEIPR